MKRSFFFYLLFFFTIVLSSVFVLASCQEKVKKVACIGDSITEGDGLQDRANEAWPAILAQQLGDKYEIKNFGQSGATLLRNGDWPYWVKPAFKEALAYNPDIVIIKLGSNDSKPQNIPSFPGEYLTDLSSMVDSFRSLPTHPDIYLCTPVPAFANRFNISDSVLVAEVIPAIHKVAKEKNCKIIDLHTVFMNQPELFPDGVHPEKPGAAEIAGVIAADLTHKKRK